MKRLIISACSLLLLAADWPSAIVFAQPTHLDNTPETWMMFDVTVTNKKGKAKKVHLFLLDDQLVDKGDRLLRETPSKDAKPTTYKLLDQGGKPQCVAAKGSSTCLPTSLPTSGSSADLMKMLGIKAKSEKPAAASGTGTVNPAPAKSGAAGGAGGGSTGASGTAPAASAAGAAASTGGGQTVAATAQNPDADRTPDANDPLVMALRKNFSIPAELALGEYVIKMKERAPKFSIFDAKNELAEAANNPQAWQQKWRQNMAMAAMDLAGGKGSMNDATLKGVTQEGIREYAKGTCLQFVPPPAAASSGGDAGKPNYDALQKAADAGGTVGGAIAAGNQVFNGAAKDAPIITDRCNKFFNEEKMGLAINSQNTGAVPTLTASPIPAPGAKLGCKKEPCSDTDSPQRPGSAFKGGLEIAGGLALLGVAAFLMTIGPAGIFAGVMALLIGGVVANAFKGDIKADVGALGSSASAGLKSAFASPPSEGQVNRPYTTPAGSGTGGDQESHPDTGM